MKKVPKWVRFLDSKPTNFQKKSGEKLRFSLGREWDINLIFILFICNQ